ncbi:MAG: T9SS type A sorting domain-containing protein [Ferruginibacter sp.]
MKKLYLFILLFTLSALGKTYAAIVVITVSNFQFSPANVNVNVGDIIRYNFVGGFHDASSVNVPSGVPAGAIDISSGAPSSAIRTYDYTVVQPGTYLYVCTIHGNAAAYSGMRGQFVASAVVPVVLRSFSISSPSKKPLLSWVTETELNADYFAVRSSPDAVHFTELARVPAVGNSTTQQAYSFTDNNVNNKNKFTYYELAVTDKDGRVQLSEIKMYKNSLSTPRLINNVGPNPITRPGQLMVYFNSEKKNKMKVKVFDAAGKRVYAADMEALPGVNSGHVHVCDFKPGIYKLQFEMEGLKETRSIVVN